MSQYDPYAPREVDPYAPREVDHTPREVDEANGRGYSPIRHPVSVRDLLRKLWAPIAAVGLAIWKLKFVFAAIFKFKLFTVAGSMLVSIAAYAWLWGWQFAIGFVLLIFVHELGHVFEAKRQGLDVTAPMFIPFLGALITLKQLPANVWNEAKLAIAGPILGSVGAAAVWAVGEAYDSELLVALAFTGFFLNLFNLAPVSPLDGGRIVAAIHPALWLVGLGVLLVLTILAPNPILILILILGGLESWRRWKERGRPELEPYYRIPPSQRLLAGVSYIVLAVLLTAAMSATFVERDL